MVSSTGAILMEPIKLIITHNVDAQLSYRTGVGSNLTRPQCLSMYRVFGLNLTVDVFFVKSNISRRKKLIFSKIKRC